MECLSTGSGEDRNPLHSSIPSTSLRGLWDLFPNSHVTQDTILTRQPCQESCLARQHGKTCKKTCKKCIRSQESSLVEGKKKKKEHSTPPHPPSHPDWPVHTLQASCSTGSVAVQLRMEQAVPAPGDAAVPAFKHSGVSRLNPQGGVISIQLWLLPLKVHVAYLLQPWS